MRRIAYMLLTLGCLFSLQAWADDDALDKAGRGIKKGGNAAGRGIEKGVDATGHGIKKGAEATGRGVEKGLNATGRGLKKAGSWLERKTHTGDK